MKFLKKLFNKSKRSPNWAFPKNLTPKEQRCKNIIDNGRGKYHEDVGKTVWFISYSEDDPKIKRCVIKAYYSSLEPDGTRSVMIVQNEMGKYEEIGMFYFLMRPHNWVVKLDYYGKSNYREYQSKIKKYLDLSENNENDFNREIKFWSKKLNNLEPELSKEEFREERLKKLLKNG